MGPIEISFSFINFPINDYTRSSVIEAILMSQPQEWINDFSLEGAVARFVAGVERRRRSN